MSVLYNDRGRVRLPLRPFLSHRFFPRALEDPSQSMLACSYTAHGDASVMQVGRVPRPLPVESQVLIRVAAAGINPVDIKMRENAIPAAYFPLPKIPGTDLSGTVVSAPADSGFAPGDRVFAMMPLLGATWGSAAEYAAVDQRLVARAPTSCSLTHAAALPMAGLTVVEGLQPVVAALGGQTSGKWALVQAGSGGVGSFAVQYCAHVLGMRVAATCSAASAARVRALGAELVLDYAAEPFEAALERALGPNAVELVVDVLSYLYEERTLGSGRVLRPGGHYVRVASSSWGLEPTQRDPLRLAIPEARVERILGGALRSVVTRLLPGAVRFHQVFVHPGGAVLREIASLVDAGKVKPIVGEELPLDGIATAHERVRSGHAPGKVIVRIGGDEVSGSEHTL